MLTLPNEFATLGCTHRIYALGARPGTLRKEISLKLPHRTHTVKRHSTFHDYRDELKNWIKRRMS